ncbi:hypothetical protein BT93_L5642 [Corymbia citriodora subsp. variegata]|uniref:Uncharacterized protein n=1 Tax=Corymbia citriodora subsp. variegata TaxID=360336 RepID=A0A8T0CT13_CORYI|nr:hypothetical protein BT93_L5642 [Corymbia citriodora subsp. variegata]
MICDGSFFVRCTHITTPNPDPLRLIFIEAQRPVSPSFSPHPSVSSCVYDCSCIPLSVDSLSKVLFKGDIVLKCSLDNTSFLFLSFNCQTGLILFMLCFSPKVLLHLPGIAMLWALLGFSLL